MSFLELPCCSARWQISPSGGGFFHSAHCLKRPGAKVDAREKAQASRHPVMSESIADRMRTWFQHSSECDCADCRWVGEEMDAVKMRPREESDA